MGDFNQYVCPADKKGGARFKYQHAKKLRDALDSYGMVDLVYIGPSSHGLI